MRLGDLIEALNTLAAELPDGLDAEVSGGACDGHGTTLTEHIEVTPLSRVAPDGQLKASTGLLRVHVHGDDVSYAPGVAEGSDQEMPDT